MDMDMAMATTGFRRTALSLLPVIALGAGLVAGAAAQSTPQAGAEDPCAAVAAGTPFPGMMGPVGPGRHGMMGTPGAGMGMMRAVDRKTADLVFIDTMIPHHQSAIAMARIAETRAENPRLREMAAKMVSDQEAEVADMQALRGTLPGGASPAMGPADLEDSMAWMMDRAGAMAGMMRGGMGIGMMGDAAGMSSLCDAQPFDLAFIDTMVPHHQAAVTMADAVISTGSSSEVRHIAQRIVDEQRAEIAEMESIRADLGGATPQP